MFFLAHLSPCCARLPSNLPWEVLTTISHLSHSVDCFEWIWWLNYLIFRKIWMFPKMGGFPPKSSTLMGFSIIFTIHFGGNTPIFGNTHIGWTNEGESVVSTQKMPPTRAIFLRKKMVRIVCLEAFTSVDKNIIRLDILPNLTSSVSQIFPEPQKSSDNIPHDFKQRYQLLLKV